MEAYAMGKESLDCEHTLSLAIREATGQGCPPLLAKALDYAVFPGGARVRPRLCLAVALANGNSEPRLASAAAAAIELLHCASLVHDDLPCFDDAIERRGKPSLHAAFGQRIAVLSGDALIVAAFQQLAELGSSVTHPVRMAQVTAIVAAGVGGPMGICAGQAWECEPRVELEHYHQAKTGALFVAATCAGAAAAGVPSEPWRELGNSIGEAYQVADDIQDAIADTATIGKPTGIDVALDRPSAVRELGLQGAVKRLERCIEKGLDSIHACKGRALLHDVVQQQSNRFFPQGIKHTAA